MHASTAKRLKREAAIREVAGTMPTWKIAEMFNISVKNLQMVCVKAGISLAYTRKPYTPLEEMYATEARAEGATINEIAQKLGRSPRGVEALLGRLNKNKSEDVKDAK